ncbi:hypothetical protein ANME2D_00028 [Candidatus Methanoperedens nitroreducens]|uniref:Uncharacterized protein n=1 Tax=Candidatus Methanoperedens nitratireducens TaxID=1392998 RepID=A0A062VCK1_9EURY|nr:hypothetical protein ANME2D_00028 [Candidatus Methanoperedens nitroreducens]
MKTNEKTKEQLIEVHEPGLYWLVLNKPTPAGD